MNQLAITVVVILLPGIIATVICDKITVHSKWDAFKYGLYSFVLGVFTYALLQLFFYAFDVAQYIGSKDAVWPGKWTHLKIWTSAVNDEQEISAWEIFLAACLSLPTAFLASWLITYKVFNKIAQALRLSAKYGDENLYSYYLNAKEIDWIYVRDPKANLTYQGRVVSHSETDDMQELVLSEVTVFRYEDSAELYSVPTIYLSKEIGQFVIEAVPASLLGPTNGKEAAN